MSQTVTEILFMIKNIRNSIAPPTPVGDMAPMEYVCILRPPCSDAEISGTDPLPIPEDLIEFWRVTKSADLFLDQTYGQWGLRILEPELSLHSTDIFKFSRKADYKPGDLVIGKFIGDSDLLIIRCDKSLVDYGSVIVALPLDSRHDWYQVSQSFTEFLEQYVRTGGEKYWATSH